MLGKKVKCIVTGFEGIATGRCEYLNGCIQYRVEPPMKSDGTTVDKWIDHGQLEVTGEGVTVVKKDNGGPSFSEPKGLSHP
jgi:hypothetical protein